MIRLFLTSVLLASAALAADKPAAVQVCVQLPAGTSLFSSAPRPFMRALGSDTWMLDFDFTLNGHAAQRLTKSGPDCFRAWLPAEKLTRVALDFSRLPLNLVNQEKALDVQLKPDLWSDGGKFVIDRVPWSTVENKTTGTLTLERFGLVISDWQQLPVGAYVLKFTPAPQPKAACPITLNVIGIGTVRADRNAELFRERVEFYRAELLPSVIARHRLQCEPAEAAQVTVKLIDGAFRNPLDPTVARVRLEEKELKYQLAVDGQISPFVDGMKVTIQPGQQLELTEQALQAAR